MLYIFGPFPLPFLPLNALLPAKTKETLLAKNLIFSLDRHWMYTGFNLQTKTISNMEKVFTNKFTFYSYMENAAMHKT